MRHLQENDSQASEGGNETPASTTKSSSQWVEGFMEAVKIVKDVRNGDLTSLQEKAKEIKKAAQVLTKEEVLSTVTHAALNAVEGIQDKAVNTAEKIKRKTADVLEQVERKIETSTQEQRVKNRLRNLHLAFNDTDFLTAIELQSITNGSQIAKNFKEIYIPLINSYHSNNYNVDVKTAMLEKILTNNQKESGDATELLDSVINEIIKNLHYKLLPEILQDKEYEAPKNLFASIDVNEAALLDKNITHDESLAQWLKGKKYVNYNNMKKDLLRESLKAIGDVNRKDVKNREKIDRDDVEVPDFVHAKYKIDGSEANKPNDESDSSQWPWWHEPAKPKSSPAVATPSTTKKSDTDEITRPLYENMKLEMCKDIAKTRLSQIDHGFWNWLVNIFYHGHIEKIENLKKVSKGEVADVGEIEKIFNKKRQTLFLSSSKETECTKLYKEKKLEANIPKPSTRE